MIIFREWAGREEVEEAEAGHEWDPGGSGPGPLAGIPAAGAPAERIAPQAVIRPAQANPELCVIAAVAARDEARAHFERALELEPDNAKVKRNLDKLEAFSPVY